ncbi:GH92 family glycosyl hydrolase [Aeoliella mucimassa]|uniref:Glycosyl hydrolase family 92 n=1 Tax=Aeoliella mucimassa TaxID=2527972 RepID=A0A518AW46_9BACT|nr:GH92 family glycosyl hydrolase [Aeoliella mucimassa]QDU58943.1 Glycosyl hydrolase family 92 [Aeoliella mucimassa]
MKNLLTALMVMALGANISWSAAPLVGDPVDCVNPLSGTNGDAEFSRGNTVAAIVAPFGMTTWAPQTDEQASPFYQMKHDKFEGIRATHQPSIWVRDYGNFLITPIVGEVSPSVAERASPFSHDQEIARPYYYSVEMFRYDTTLELTPTERCAMFQVQYPTTDQASLVLSLEGDVEATSDASRTRVRGKATHVTFGAPGGFAKYFVLEFEQPYQSLEVAKDDKQTTATIQLPQVQSDQPVRFKVGTSFISYEQAELNLKRELATWDFDQAKASSREAWEKQLARVEIKGASDQQRATFYTALYRSLQFPRMFHEPDTDGNMRHYSPFANGKVFDGPLYTDNGLWDTYRTAFPFFVLYYPEHSSQILEGWLNAYREGGRLPNWPSPGNRPCMIGSHSDSIFADAWVKGLRTFDLKDAYAAVKKNAMEDDAWGWAGRDHLNEYHELGYVPVDARKDAATSCTLEYAYDDYCVAQLAKAIGRQEDYELLMQRAKNYRNVWDEQTEFMRGKQSNGAWQEPFDPLAWGGAYVEGNAWQWMWSVQHDPYGLMQLLGGREAMARKLDEFLSMPSTTVVGSYGHVIHEMREVEHAKMGQYAHINEPNHHVLYFYHFVREPWKTQHAVRRVMDELYDPDGMVGDEDTGQMSAWYVFNAAGFYPFCPGTPYYLIGSPLFAETTIALPQGKSFVVRAANNSAENCYIQSARLNGKPLTRTWLTHNEIVAGGTLEFEMGPEPNRQWGTGEADAPPNTFR